VSDLFTLEIIGNTLRSIVDEMGIQLMRSSYSAMIKEGKDCSAQIFDSLGRIIVQGEHIPMHIGGIAFLGKEMLNTFKEFEEDDIYVTNDPFIGGSTHLLDICVIIPLIFKGELVAFIATVAHHTDIGGIVEGSESPGARNVYQEGIRIPLGKLKDKNGYNKALINIIQYNVRNSEILAGDIEAQIGACKHGKKRLLEILNKYGVQTFNNTIQNLIKMSEQAMRKEILKIPNGQYTFTDYVDNSNIINCHKSIPLKVTIKVLNDELYFDFRDNIQQVEGPINLVKSGLASCVYFAVSSITKPLYLNEGAFYPIHITTIKGTILDASFPAATACRSDLAQRVVDVVCGALSRAIDKIPAASHGTATTISLGGYNPGMKKRYVEALILGGGGGASKDGDGTNGIQVYITNADNVPIELLEQDLPLLVEQLSIRPNSGGAGKYRGGTGLRFDLKLIGPSANVTIKTGRFKTAPWGIMGGESGAKGECLVYRTDGTIEELESRATVQLFDGDLISLRTPGGGGFGTKKERSFDLIEEDLLNGYITKKE